MTTAIDFIKEAVAGGFAGGTAHVATLARPNTICPSECKFNETICNKLNIGTKPPNRLLPSLIPFVANAIEVPVQRALEPAIGTGPSCAVSSLVHELLEASAARFLLQSQCYAVPKNISIGLTYAFGASWACETAMMYGYRESEKNGNTVFESVVHGSISCAVTEMATTPLRIAQRGSILNLTAQELQKLDTKKGVKELAFTRCGIGTIRGGIFCTILSILEKQLGVTID